MHILVKPIFAKIVRLDMYIFSFLLKKNFISPDHVLGIMKTLNTIIRCELLYLKKKTSELEG